MFITFKTIKIWKFRFSKKSGSKFGLFVILYYSESISLFQGLFRHLWIGKYLLKFYTKYFIYYMKEFLKNVMTILVFTCFLDNLNWYENHKKWEKLSKLELSK